jgi:hypothetical protein
MGVEAGRWAFRLAIILAIPEGPAGNNRPFLSFSWWQYTSIPLHVHSSIILGSTLCPFSPFNFLVVTPNRRYHTKNLDDTFLQGMGQKTLLKMTQQNE